MTFKEVISSNKEWFGIDIKVKNLKVFENLVNWGTFVQSHQ